MSPPEVVPNLQYAKQHVQLLTGDEDTPITFQTFPDHDGESRYAPQFFHGTVEECWPRILKLIEAGHGIFLMVNSGDFQGRSSQNVIGVRALFTDQEDEEVRKYLEHYRPSFVIQSQRGPHSYWRMRDGEPLDQFSPAQQQLASHFKTDPKVKDLPRVMRLAGSLHQKDPAKPFLVYVKEAHTERCYTIAELLAAYPAPEPQKKAKKEQAPRPRSENSSRTVRSTGTSRIAQAKQYISTQPPAIENQGGDAATYELACAVVRGFDLDEEDALAAFADWNDRCVPPWSEQELVQKFENARRYGSPTPSPSWSATAAWSSTPGCRRRSCPKRGATPASNTSWTTSPPVTPRARSGCSIGSPRRRRNPVADRWSRRSSMARTARARTPWAGSSRKSSGGRMSLASPKTT
jgi:hypothetical protein